MTVGFEAHAEPPVPAGDDVVRPFEVAALDVRGRAIQMGPALDAILSRHDYPPAVSRLLAEAIILAVLLGSSLKFDGKFILQTETEGPVDLLVVDYRTTGGIRAYARFDRERVAATGEVAEPGALLGKGTLAMTVDQGEQMNRYQGVVPLQAGESLEAAAHTYFRQSEQIPTRVRLAVAELQEREDSGAVRHSWRAGGLLVQFLPKAPERQRHQDLPGGDLPEGAEVERPDEDDAWVEAQALVGTTEDHELTDPAVPVDRLLFRLFNQRGVRVYHPSEVSDSCSCSRAKISDMLGRFSTAEIVESTEAGKISVTCEFCGTRYQFDPGEFLG
jgi:molecular chaperone Hsp33